MDGLHGEAAQLELLAGSDLHELGLACKAELLQLIADEAAGQAGAVDGQIELLQQIGDAADVVLMDDDPLKISKAIKISRKCLRIVYQNIVFAIGVKFICLLLGALGIANMWLAIFADVGVMILAVINAIRALFVKKL